MNGNQKINNLKRLVVIISIAILIVAVVLIMSIYNNKFGKVGGSSAGGRSTVSTSTTDVIIDPDNNGEEITNAPTTEVTTEPTSEATTAGGNVTTRTNKTTYKTQKPTSGQVVITDPPVKYNVVSHGSGSGFPNSNNTLEWALFDELNGRRNTPLQMSSELRSRAETAANNALGTYVDSLQKGFCTCPNDPNCICNTGGYKGEGAANCVYYNRSTYDEANRLVETNSEILNDNYKYVGIGVVQNGDNFGYVVIVD